MERHSRADGDLVAVAVGDGLGAGGVVGVTELVEVGLALAVGDDAGLLLSDGVGDGVGLDEDPVTGLVDAVSVADAVGLGDGDAVSASTVPLMGSTESDCVRNFSPACPECA